MRSPLKLDEIRGQSFEHFLFIYSRFITSSMVISLYASDSNQNSQKVFQALALISSCVACSCNKDLVNRLRIESSESNAKTPFSTMQKSIAQRPTTQRQRISRPFKYDVITQTVNNSVRRHAMSALGLDIAGAGLSKFRK